MAKGGRTYVSKDELAVIESIKYEKQKILDIEKEELQNIKDMKQAYADTGDESLRLTAAMKEKLRMAEVDKTLSGETLSLEKKLNKQAKSLNTQKKKGASLASAMLEDLKSDLERGDLTTQQYEDHVAVLDQIATGTASVADIQEAIGDLGEDATESMKKYLAASTQAAATNDLAKNAIDGMDGILGGMAGKVKSALTNPMTLATALLLQFNATQETIAKEFGAMGVGEFRTELASANQEFTAMGLSGADAQSTISNLANGFGLSVSESRKLASNVKDVAIVTGTSLENTSKLVGLFTETQGLTGQQAENLLISTNELAGANNVAPNKVLEEVASNTEFFAQFAADGGKNILRAAVQAKKLGLELSQVEKITSGLLDFQNSLNAETEASVLIGRRLNFQKARELALANDVEGATAAVVEQLGSAEEFNKLNAIQRKALADSVGLEVSALSKVVNKEKEALTLSGALSQQKVDLIPEETVTATAQLIGQLQAIGMSLAESVGPTLNFVLGAFAGLVSMVDKFIGLGPALLGLFVAIKMNAMIAAAAQIYNAIAGFFGGAALGSTATLGFGTLALVGIAATAVGMMMSALMATPTGDLGIDPNGGPIVASPTMGGLFQGKKGDGLSMGPGFGTNGDTSGGGGVGVDTSRLEALQAETSQKLERVAAVLEGALSGPKPALARAMGSSVGDTVDGMA